MTLLIASLFADTVEELELLAASAWSAKADAVEIRMDTFREPLPCLHQFLNNQSNRQWLVTCRSQAEGGFFIGDGVAAALRGLEAVEGTNAWVDAAIAAWRADEKLRTRLKSHLGGHAAAKLVLSAHFTQDSPPNLESLVEEALHEGPPVVTKIAYAGTHIADSFPAMDLMRQYGDRVIAICMGETGAWTRVLAKKLGAFATFAALDLTTPTAPGQCSVEELRQDFGWDRIDSETRVYGVAGDPIAHSMSPRLFNHWFGQHDCNAVYLPLRVSSDHGGLTRFLAECERRHWLHLRGLSVTIPHKVAALNWAGDAADPMSREIGAVNTLVLGDDATAAYNTDCYAAVDSLAAALGRRRDELAGLTVDVLGAGGAARAVCYGLAEMGCRVTAFARAPQHAKDYERWGVTIRSWHERIESSGEALVNCTPLGMWPHIHESPMPAESLADRRLVFDLIYRPLQTRLLTDASAAGCTTLSGLDMFVRQAATQFALWTGVSPNITSAYELLEADLQREADRKTCVALIGARGSGKTTVGTLLARLLGVAHIDTDELVMTASGQSIAQIFEAEGEAGFRSREREAVENAIVSSHAVISLGGGAVLDPRNIEALRKVAHIVWLTAPVDVLVQRVSQDPKSCVQRPGLTTDDAKMEMEQVLREREPLYRAATDFIVDTSVIDASEVTRWIASWFERDSSRSLPAVTE